MENKFLEDNDNLEKDIDNSEEIILNEENEEKEELDEEKKELDKEKEELDKELDEEVIQGNIYEKDVYYPNFLFAGFAIRTVAFILDAIVIYAISKIILDSLGSFLNIRDNGLFFSVYNLIYLSIYLGYFTIMTKLTNGQTLGKMVMGLRVVSLHEKKLSWITVFTREFLGRFILKRLKFLYLISIFSMEKQQLADILANTSVVREGYLLEYKKIEEMNKELNFE